MELQERAPQKQLQHIIIFNLFLYIADALRLEIVVEVYEVGCRRMEEGGLSIYSTRGQPESVNGWQVSRSGIYADAAAAAAAAGVVSIKAMHVDKDQ